MKTILHKENLALGGFAGLKEHRLVMSSKVWGNHKNKDTLDGLGNFIYFADAYFNPYGETHLHSHENVDVISIMVEGEILHEGSLESGLKFFKGDVQVQSTGQEGFSHNEINPNPRKNRMLQLWFKPEHLESKASYKIYTDTQVKVTNINGLDTEFNNATSLRIIKLRKNETFNFESTFQAYIYKGKAIVNSEVLEDGNLFEDNSLEIQALDETHFFLVSVD